MEEAGIGGSLPELRELLYRWHEEGVFDGWNENNVHAFCSIVKDVMQKGELHHIQIGDDVFYCAFDNKSGIATRRSTVTGAGADSLEVATKGRALSRGENKGSFDRVTGISEQGPNGGFIAPNNSYLS
jgi:hypothetical protein